jgi:hypothetical protein
MSTADVGESVERGGGGRGRSYTLQEFLADGVGHFPEKKYRVCLNEGFSKIYDKKRQGLRIVFRLRLC